MAEIEHVRIAADQACNDSTDLPPATASGNEHGGEVDSEFLQRLDCGLLSGGKWDGQSDAESASQGPDQVIRPKMAA
jgi:hypothetical protein